MLTPDRNSNKNNLAESFKMFATSLYQVAAFLTTFIIVGGKAVFDLLHEKLVERPRVRRAENERKS